MKVSVVSLEVTGQPGIEARHSQEILPIRTVWQRVRDPTDQMPAPAGDTVVASQARCGPMNFVPAEQLVATIARKHHLDMLRRELGNDIGRDRRRIAKRFVEMPDQLLDQ